VIVADPPWSYESGNSLPYPTMDLQEIKAMPVAEIADENAILWLWTTIRPAIVFRSLRPTAYLNTAHRKFQALDYTEFLTL
jgi:N6-adenosine-specific RNA methylase IME4